MNEQEIRNNERFFIILGDNAYFIPEIRIHWNIIVALSFITLNLVHFSHMKNPKGDWHDLLDLLIGDIKPCNIGLNHVDDIHKILKRLVLE